MLARILSLVRNLVRKRAVEQALDDELESSAEILTEEKMKEGQSRPEARRQALMELGGVEQVKEEVRAIRAGRRDPRLHPRRTLRVAALQEAGMNAPVTGLSTPDLTAAHRRVLMLRMVASVG